MQEKTEHCGLVAIFLVSGRPTCMHMTCVQHLARLMYQHQDTCNEYYGTISILDWGVFNNIHSIQIVVNLETHCTECCADVHRSATITSFQLSSTLKAWHIYSNFWCVLLIRWLAHSLFGCCSALHFKVLMLWLFKHWCWICIHSHLVKRLVLSCVLSCMCSIVIATL